MALLTVRAAAERLGSHENTVRHWEERGILRAMHLPGSGFRRFPTEEVERVAATMRASFDTHPDVPDVVEDRFVDGTYEPALGKQE